MSQALQCQEFVKSNGCEIVGLSLFKLNLSTMFSTINKVAFFVIKMFVLSWGVMAQWYKSLFGIKEVLGSNPLVIRWKLCCVLYNWAWLLRYCGRLVSRVCYCISEKKASPANLLYVFVMIIIITSFCLVKWSCLNCFCWAFCASYLWNLLMDPATLIYGN
jgi:hypothetical protein